PKVEFLRQEGDWKSQNFVLFNQDYSNPKEGIFITRPLTALVDNGKIDDNFGDDPSGQNTDSDGSIL
ncbi:MAG: hypothetical protein RMK18_12955, partial [Armatimonadota bacterium]|nr:hypothetical protein [Armatimonadota bacterium]